MGSLVSIVYLNLLKNGITIMYTFRTTMMFLSALDFPHSNSHRVVKKSGGTVSPCTEHRPHCLNGAEYTWVRVKGLRVFGCVPPLPHALSIPREPQSARLHDSD